MAQVTVRVALMGTCIEEHFNIPLTIASSYTDRSGDDGVMAMGS